MPPCFLNCPVEAELQWPRKEALVSFGAWEIIAFPPSREHDPSLHIDLRRARISGVEAGSILSQLLSIASWLDDTYAVLLPGWSGNPVPRRPSRDTKSWPSSILDTWCNSWHPIEDEKIRRALAIYREAVNMEHFHSLPYAVLGYYKIFEFVHDKQHIRSRLTDALAEHLSTQMLENLRHIGFDREPSPENIQVFLSDEGRHAVAHAASDPIINPDDFRDQRAMSVAAQILRAVARSAIKSKFRVSTNPWDQTDLN